MKSPRITAADLANRLDAKQVKGGWMALCPAHDDHDPSLSISEAANGNTLLNCLAGCKFDHVIAALGIEPIQLFALKERKRPISDAKVIIATYDYVNASSELVFQVKRYDPKDFRQCRPDGKGGTIWNTKGIGKPLYRLPKVIEAIAKGERIYIVEGERDVHALESLGQYATCNAGGAEKWTESYTAALQGAELVVIADKDEPGRRHAQTVRNAVSKVVKSVKVIELPDRNEKTVKDASDWISAGGTLAELEAIVQNAPEAPEAPEQDAGAVQPIGAGEWLSQPDEPDRPIINGLFDECDRVAIVGQSKARKSFYALQLGVAIATGSKMLGSTPNAFKVLLVNGEISTHAYKKRLRSMIAGLEINAGLLDNLRVLNLANSSEVTTFATVLNEAVKQKCEVCIIDPVYLLITDELDQKEVKAAVLEMKKFSAEKITLISVYHSTKGKIGDRQGIDRISGSGILARDCSTLISLCEHASEPDHVVISAITRNYAPSEPITAKFNNGAFLLSDIAPIEANSTTRPRRVIPVEEAIKAFTEESICYGDAVKAVKKQCSCSDVPAKDLISEMTKKGMLFRMELGRRTMYSAIKRESV